ncbi:CDP-alcohol phosphatidyltransferase family protein [Yinghuangia seranimata]|uniref:CDP-alcohol phosphatidyltransferase family protein n=1 Tax=Yinghuangia seranimata TaxID=408067 RepID=UPI00248ACBBB|nr:CDP-alcohol phosphatidyltransferase family protein [Yinghuangia seranimata]MDI2131719.1 CDP-alcohol phosphatidyltransferase family protein [Yinghuangia seranimata]
MSTPTAAELRAVCHPAGLLDRRSGEHWAGRLYMRRISLQLTRHLVGTRITPNQLTYLMIVAGVGAGAVLALPGLAGPLLAAILIQVYLLLDCVDGEVARWRRQTSVTGVYLDRVGHYLSEAALLVGAGLHASDVAGDGRLGGWAFLGAIAALGAILIKSETDLVDVSRARSGLPPVQDSASVPRSSGAATARKVAASLKFHRLVGGVEASLLLLAAGLLDAWHGDLVFSRVAVAVLAAVAVLQTVLHLASILLSSRLK